jgi:hypothetical protein
MIDPPATRAGGGRAVATSAKQREERAARERTRQYQARQTLHADRTRRRTRDNVIAGVVGGVLLLAIIGGQILFYTTGPGAPEPAPSPTPTVTSTGSGLPLP